MTTDQQVRRCAGFILFMSGLFLGVVMRPEPGPIDPYMLATDAIQTQMAVLAESCEKPQTGQVAITSDHVIDAIRGKKLEFIVNTTTGSN